MAQFASNPFQVVYLFSNKKITIYSKKTPKTTKQKPVCERRGDKFWLSIKKKKIQDFPIT